jgi:hypothetical protein
LGMTDADRRQGWMGEAASDWRRGWADRGGGDECLFLGAQGRMAGRRKKCHEKIVLGGKNIKIDVE